jgi:putative Ca2+/H+ antiporter (TMEM165/GDT1 family)
MTSGLPSPLATDSRHPRTRPQPRRHGRDLPTCVIFRGRGDRLQLCNEAVGRSSAVSRREFSEEGNLAVDLRLFATVFATIFVAELGDKTQLATLLYASDVEHSKLTVFAGAAAALIVATALGVVGGAVLSEFVDPKVLRWVAGLGFIGVGIWVLVGADGEPESAPSRDATW